MRTIDSLTGHSFLIHESRNTQRPEENRNQKGNQSESEWNQFHFVLFSQVKRTKGLLTSSCREQTSGDPVGERPHAITVCVCVCVDVDWTVNKVQSFHFTWCSQTCQCWSVLPVASQRMLWCWSWPTCLCHLFLSLKCNYSDTSWKTAQLYNLYVGWQLLPSVSLISLCRFLHFVISDF